MNLVAELVAHQQGLRTVILNTDVLSYPAEFLEPWFFNLNTLSLKFLCVVDAGDIDKAFRNLDKSGNGKISMSELGKSCGPQIAQYWSYKYGEDYEVPCQHQKTKRMQ